MTGSKEIRVRLFRYDPSADENPRYEIFSVPKRPDMRVLDALNHIYNLEETGAVAYRWYCGIEWFGFSPANRAVVGVGSALLGLAAYFGWAWRAVQRPAPRPVVVDSPPIDKSTAVGHNPTAQASDKS